MRPKSLLAVMLSIAMLLAGSVVGPVFAADCTHVYEQTVKAATCIEKEQIVYTCSLCGDTYKVAADEPMLPDSCYVLLESTKQDGQLIVTVKLENNPGIYSMRMIFHYNEAALAPTERINGDVWTDSECWTTTPPKENPFFYTAQYTDMTSNNMKNGLLCTLVFDILDEKEDYGFRVTYDKRPYITYDHQLVDVTTVNIVGKSEYGDHCYESGMVPPTCTKNGYTQQVCKYCQDTIIGETIPSPGHQWVLTQEIVPPTFETEGRGVYTCSACHETKEESLPILQRWKKGDLNNDGAITSADIIYLRRVAASASSVPLQLYDAADVNGDSVVTMLDYVQLSRIAAGNAPYPPDWNME